MSLLKLNRIQSLHIDPTQTPSLTQISDLPNHHLEDLVPIEERAQELDGGVIALLIPVN
jgi:hypothetical protein